MSSMTAIAAAQELTAADRDQAQLFLKQTKQGAIGAIKGLSFAQWNFTPAADHWSIAQIVEHVIFVLDRVGGPIQALLGQAPPPPVGRDYRHVDAIIIHQFPTRLSKFPAPEFALPAGLLGSPAEAIDQLTKSYAQLAWHIDHTPDLRAHALEAAPLKAVTGGAYDVMDGYQWILACAAHAERHTKQILEWRASELFPATGVNS